MGSLVLLDLMGGVALLLWGLHMVHSGILRAFGPRSPSASGGSVEKSFCCLRGRIGLTALLQSSTATALITSSFTAEGLVSLVPALAIMLGANVGTTLIVQILSFNIAAAALGPVHHRPGRLPQRRALAHQGHRPRLDRPRPDAAGAAYPARHAGAGGECAGRARVHERHHRRSRALHRHRRGRHLGGAFQRRQRSAGHVAGLRAIHHALRRWRWCSAPISAAPSIRCSRAPAATIPASYRLPVGNLVNRLVGVLLVAPFLRPIAECSRGLAARPCQDDRGVSHRVQRGDRGHLHRPARRHGAALEKAASEPDPGNRSVAAALSRRERAGDALARAGGRRARNPAHGRSSSRSCCAR